MIVVEEEVEFPLFNPMRTGDHYDSYGSICVRVM